MTALDDHRRLGDQYTFVALDPETKIVPAYPVGKRDLPTATAFITDFSERLANRATSKRLSGLSSHETVKPSSERDCCLGKGERIWCGTEGSNPPPSSGES